VAALEARLVGDIGVETLAEQRGLATAMVAIIECLRVEMETVVGETHPPTRAPREGRFFSSWPGTVPARGGFLRRDHDR